jgi:hypothetical protein
MKFAPRSRSFARASFAPLAPGALSLFLLLTLASSGCENKHIGRLCDLNVTDDGGSPSGTATSATINSEALECPSRVCLKPGNQTDNTDTTSLCTADCSSDDDCSDGETGPKGNTSDHHCEKGFSCIIPTTAGDLCCRKFCVCKDFLVPVMGDFKPPIVCQSGHGSSCKNVSP